MCPYRYNKLSNNKWGDVIALFHNRFQLITIEERNIESLIDKHHSNCCRKDTLTDPKISRHRFEEKYDLHNTKVSLSKYYINYKGKGNNFTMKKLVRHQLNQVIKVKISPSKTYQPQESLDMIH